MTKAIEHASELRGVLIVAREEGAQLGTVIGININPETKSISAIRFRPKSGGRDERFVEMRDVQLVGRDVVLVASEASAKTVEDGVKPPGKDLEDLQGAWVTTLEGKHLGTLVDVDFRPNDWLISELTLSDGKSLAVEADKVRIGDEILVPVDYASRVKEAPEQAGLMSRVFGADTIDRIKKALIRQEDSKQQKPADDN